MNQFPSKSYKFDGFIFDAEKPALYHQNRLIKNIGKKPLQVLAVLVQNANQLTLHDEIINRVWQDKFFDVTSIDTAQCVSKLRKLLSKYESGKSFIETVKGSGYMFVGEVTSEKLELPESSSSEESISAYQTEKISADADDSPVSSSDRKAAPGNKPFLADEIETKVSVPNRHLAFISAVGFFYGLLFWAALLLESAYKFQDYQSKVFALAVPLILWNGATMFAGLALTEGFLRRNRRNALFFGIISLIFGAFVSCLIIGLVLPNEPVTAARFQTQPALGAYIKNVWMYFLPLGIGLILLPFYAVCGRQYEKKVFTVSPSILLGFWLLALIFSIFSTFYLLDNLLPLENHGLFVIAVILRFVIYFGLGLTVLIWYFSRSKDISAPETRFSAKQQIALLFILSAIGLDCL